MNHLVMAERTPKQTRHLRYLQGVQLFIIFCMVVSMFVAPIPLVVLYLLMLRSTTPIYLELTNIGSW